MTVSLRVAVCLLACLLFCSCAKPSSDRKETFPVTGEIYVDGQPGKEIQVVLHDVNKNTTNPTYSTTFSGADGKFTVSTYEEGDGVPEGEYAVTFMWGEMNLLTMQYGGPDKLKDKYNDPDKTTFRIKVVKGQPADMGRIDLTTK